jgi:ATP-dependent DNA helicase RecG
MARLNTMRTTYDGYAIAEQDLVQRGPGDFLGSHADSSVRQSGGLSFRLADAGEDVSILKDATKDAKELLAADPELSNQPLLAHKIAAMFDVEQGLIS